MKTSILRTALIAATTAITFNTFAGEPTTTSTAATEMHLKAVERELGRQINKYVVYPVADRTSQMEGEVFVSFVIGIEGTVKVISAHSTNQALCEYVLRKLSKVDIGDNPEGLWKTTHMRFTFRPEA